MIMQMVFSEVFPACHDIANGIKPGSNSKKTEKHAADGPKSCMLGLKVIYVRSINCSISIVAIGISLLDKKAIFYTGKISCKSF